MCLTDRVKHSLQGLLKPSNNLLLVTVVTVLLFGLQQQVKNRILLFFRVIISGTGSWGQEGWKQMNEMYDWCPLCAVDNNCVFTVTVSTGTLAWVRAACNIHKKAMWRAGWRIWFIPEPSWQPATQWDTCDCSMHSLWNTSWLSITSYKDLLCTLRLLY